MKHLGLAAATALGLATASPALAQTCFGVEARVNLQTGALASAVTSTVTTTEAAMIAQEVLQRAQLVSAIRVLTGQASTGSDQFGTGLKASSEALAATVVSQRLRQSVAEAGHRYQSTGFDPCSSNAKARSLYGAIAAAPAQRRQIASAVLAKPGEYADPSRWTAAMRTGTAPDAGTLYDGDQAGATKFINAVVGAPDRPVTAAGRSTGEADLDRLRKTNLDTYRSLSATVLADIAADYAPGGPMERARELSKHWQGDDGGERWGAALAPQHARGVVQDAVRMEAANLALLAMQLKRGARTEAAVASLHLALVNSKVGGATPAADLTP